MSAQPSKPDALHTTASEACSDPNALGLSGADTILHVSNDESKAESEKSVVDAAKAPIAFKDLPLPQFPYNAPAPVVELLHAVWRQDIDSINKLKKSVNINANCMGVTIGMVILKHLVVMEQPYTEHGNFLINVGVTPSECRWGLIWGGFDKETCKTLSAKWSDIDLIKGAYYSLAGGHQALADSFLGKLKKKPIPLDYYVHLVLGAAAAGNLGKMLEYKAHIKNIKAFNVEKFGIFLGSQLSCVRNSIGMVDLNNALICHAAFFNRQDIVQHFLKLDVKNHWKYYDAVFGAIAGGHIDSVGEYLAQYQQSNQVALFAGAALFLRDQVFKVVVQNGQKTLVWPLWAMVSAKMSDGKEDTKDKKIAFLNQLKGFVNDAYPYMREYLAQLEAELDPSNKKKPSKTSNSASASVSSSSSSSSASSSPYASAFLNSFSSHSSMSSLNSLSSSSTAPMMNGNSSSSNCLSESFTDTLKMMTDNQHQLTSRLLQLEKEFKQQALIIQGQNEKIQTLMNTCEALKRQSKASQGEGEGVEDPAALLLGLSEANASTSADTSSSSSSSLSSASSASLNSSRKRKKRTT